MEIRQQDWKLFMKRVAQWQERYMGKLCDEYRAILDGSQSASDRFWALEKRLRKDKRSPGVSLELRKSDMLWQIAGLLCEGVITLEDLDGFSEDVIEAVRMIARI